MEALQFNRKSYCIQSRVLDKMALNYKFSLKIILTNLIIFSLLLYGLILSQKEEYEDAETCLLNMMIQYQRWAEGKQFLLIEEKKTFIYI